MYRLTEGAQARHAALRTDVGPEVTALDFGKR